MASSNYSDSHLCRQSTRLVIRLCGIFFLLCPLFSLNNNSSRNEETKNTAMLKTNAIEHWVSDFRSEIFSSAAACQFYFSLNVNFWKSNHSNWLLMLLMLVLLPLLPPSILSVCHCAPKSNRKVLVEKSKDQRNQMRTFSLFIIGNVVKMAKAI